MATGGRVDGSKANGGRRHAATEDGGPDAVVVVREDQSRLVALSHAWSWPVAGF
jgi:hypothetical protein